MNPKLFPRSCAIHSPTYSGVRVTAEMGDYVKSLYEVPGPLIVEHGYAQVFRWYQEQSRQLGGIPSVRLDYQRSGLDPASLRVLQHAA